jgi:mannose-6-phosphate isomerase-like protein (cupin superfamily)
MAKTSFGFMDIIHHIGNKPSIELISFEREGRAHRHNEYESFFVFKGTGKVVSGEKIYNVSPGSLVEIPPQTDHWMIPDEGQVLEGFLWYHLDRIELNQS